MFSPSNELFIFFTTDCCLVKMTSNFFNANLFLNLYAAVVLQSMVTLTAPYLTIRFLLACFLAHQLVRNYVFHGRKDIYLQSFANFYDLILPVYVFYSTTIFHHCLLLLLHYFSVCFSAYINHIYILYVQNFQDFLFLFCLIISS